jgi:hypothetical protein
LQPGALPQLRQSPFPGDSARRQQDQPVADARGVGELVNREEERPAFRRGGAKYALDLASLPQVQAVEGFVEEEDLPRHGEAEGEEHPAPLPFRELADVFGEEPGELQLLRQRGEPGGIGAEEAREEGKNARGRLLRPGSDLVGQVEQDLLAAAGRERAALPANLTGVGRELSREAFEEGRLAGPVGPDQPEDFPAADPERDLVQRRDRAEPLRDAPNLRQRA